MDTTTRPEFIHVCRDTTPGLHRTDSDAIAWWLPVIGPSSAVLAHLFARHTPPAGATWHTESLAKRIGLAGRRRTLWCTLDRLAMFRVVTFHATDVLTIRTQLPALTSRQLERLPAEFAVDYIARFATRAA